MHSLSSSSLKMFSVISSIRKEFSERLFRTGFSVTLQSIRVSLTRITPNSVPSTLLWHRFCSTDRKTFSFLSLSLCLATVFRLHPFFAFHLKSKIIVRTLRNRGFKHCGNTGLTGVLVRDSRSRRNCGWDRCWASCHHPRKWSCRTFWAHNLWWGRTWPGSRKTYPSSTLSMRTGEKLQNWVVDTWKRRNQKSSWTGKTPPTFGQEMAWAKMATDLMDGVLRDDASTPTPPRLDWMKSLRCTMESEPSREIDGSIQKTVVTQSTDCCSHRDKICGSAATGKGRHDEERLEHDGQNHLPRWTCVPRTCVCIWLVQEAKLRDAGADLRVSCAFWMGK